MKYILTICVLPLTMTACTNHQTLNACISPIVGKPIEFAKINYGKPDSIRDSSDFNIGGKDYTWRKSETFLNNRKSRCVLTAIVGNDNIIKYYEIIGDDSQCVHFCVK